MKEVFYWCPHINPQVATCKSVINSAYSLKKYSKNFDPVIINCFGEWNYFKDELSKKNIRLVNLFNFNIKLPINGFFKSRFFYIIFSLIAILPLLKLVKTKKPDYLILHLIVIPALFISSFYKINTKFILRISGYPKLNLFRKFFWNFFSKNLFMIFSPTRNTINLLREKKIFEKKKIKLLEDPIIEISKINKFKRESLLEYKKDQYLVSIGRLTRQKNFKFLINSCSSFINENDLKLLIIGSGELEKNLNEKIKNLNLENQVILTGYKKNIFNYIHNSKMFILTSDWEDPGFVLIEAAATGKLIICANVQSGPIEFIGNDEKCGILYKNNSFEDFQKKTNIALKNLNTPKYKLRILNAKKKSINYTLFRHSKKLLNYLTSLN